MRKYSFILLHCTVTDLLCCVATLGMIPRWAKKHVSYHVGV